MSTRYNSQVSHKSKMQISRSRIVLIAVAVLVFVSSVPAQRRRTGEPASGIAPNVLLQIIRAEDERRWDQSLNALLEHRDAKVRRRAALAAGRIGNEGAIPTLADMVLMDRDTEVREMAAFALGEIESPGSAYALVTVVKDPARAGRARALEALGKVTAALLTTVPPGTPDDDRLDTIKAAIVNALRFENGRRSNADRLTVLLGLTAVLRARPDGAGSVIRPFLTYDDPRIVADALNTLARLRSKDANAESRALLIKHRDPVVRANAARVVGAAEDKEAVDALLDRALQDSDLRVRVSAIRALGSLKDVRVAEQLTTRAEHLGWRVQNEILEIFTALGNIFAVKGGDNRAKLLSDSPVHLSARGLVIAANGLRAGADHSEVHIAAAKVNPDDYLQGVSESVRRAEEDPLNSFRRWRRTAAIAQGLRTIATLKADEYGKNIAGAQDKARVQLRLMLNDPRLSPFATPDVMQAYAAFKPADIGDVVRRGLAASDVIIRSTAAELVGDQPPGEVNTRALMQALPRALSDKDLNDAALAILDALGKQKNKEANDAIKTALDSSDHLIRRRAVALLKANGAGDFSDRIGTVQTRNTTADYRRALARIGRRVTATVVTTKGAFTIEFLPEEAPLNVDNFVQLARKGYFNGQTVPRVVPNFVIQTGDPRGDQNGGPGYQIRCEINQAAYDRAAVGMALSGKDTGGSQWFVTHSPQPHLDGGYTVFGRVISGMDVVDRIARGDTIRRVIVNDR